MIFQCLKILCLALLVQLTYQTAIQLDSGNVDIILENNDIILINFYANWCRFSQMLEPVYNEFAEKFRNEVITVNVRVAVAKVDCDSQPDIATKYQISKYPTIKLYRYGVIAKREYRGPRTVEGFMAFLKEQMNPPIRQIDYTYRLHNIDLSKRTAIIGFFEKEDSPTYRTFVKVASVMRDSCNFVAAVGDNAQGHLQDNKDSLMARSSHDGMPIDVKYESDIAAYDVLYSWISDQCTKLVREITFENAEELTEEGLPFLILFYKPGDMESVRRFDRQVTLQLAHEKTNINAVYADGQKFSHPLHHLGKSFDDLPVLAIDSFRHMYLFSNMNELDIPGKLNQFVQDLHSGKLHREFHNGPDPVAITAPPSHQVTNKDGTVHIPKDSDNHDHNQHAAAGQTEPPESAFGKLKPSNKRYTILKDEF